MSIWGSFYCDEFVQRLTDTAIFANKHRYQILIQVLKQAFKIFRKHEMHFTERNIEVGESEFQVNYAHIKTDTRLYLEIGETKTKM